MITMGKPGIHGTNVISVGARGTRVSRAVETLILHDEFVGTGSLADHNPSPVHTWDNWRYAGFAGGAWTMNGDGTVSQTSNPTGPQGVQFYVAFCLVASKEPLVRVQVLTPASGAFRVGVFAREIWIVILNSTNNRLEIIDGTNGLVAAFVSAGTLANNTQYTVEIECVGTTITARGAGVSVQHTSATSQEKMFCGLVEAVANGDGHGKFQSIRARASNAAGATAGRIIFLQGNAAPDSEFDSVADSGTASTVRETGSGNGVFAMQITANGSDSGTRLQFQCDASGLVSSKEAANAVKNLPDEAYYTCYYYIPSVIQRLSQFWMIIQMKQRGTDNAAYPIYSLNVGYTNPNMHLEVNSNMGASGEFDNGMPDLSATHFTLPAGQWVRIDMLFKWGVTDGRLAFWLDNALMWDFPNIQTLFTEPPADWLPPQNTRQVSVTHYAHELSPATSKIYTDNFSVTVGSRPPDAYPSVAPV